MSTHSETHRSFITSATTVTILYEDEIRQAKLVYVGNPPRKVYFDPVTFSKIVEDGQDDLIVSITAPTQQ